MARYSIDGQILTDIADAIRNQVGETEYKEFLYTSMTYHFDATFYTMSSSNRLLIPVCGATQIKIVRLAYTGSGGSFYISGGTAQVTDNSIVFGENTKTCTFTNLSSDYVSMYSLGGNSTYDFEATWYDADGNQMEVVMSEEVRKTMTPERMAAEINGLAVMEPSLLDITDTMHYKFYAGAWDDFIKVYGDKITTNNIGSLLNAFASSKVSHIPFEINCRSSDVDCSNCFDGCDNLVEPVVINNLKPSNMRYMFRDCQKIRYFPENYGEDWDWSYHTTSTSSYQCYKSGMFEDCYSLRKLPMGLLKYGNPVMNVSYHPLRDFRNLYSLDEIVDFPYPHNTECKGTSSSGLFYNTLTGLQRCKKFTFAPDIGVKQWAKQVLDLSKLGYGYSSTNFYNSGITADKQVTDEASYIALRKDPDWFSTDVGYSRYNLLSAIDTINSLPDCSEYAAANGTNTIKFKGDAGNKTSTSWVGDTPINTGSGAINKLTDEQIAVAAAKGWTVTLV